MLGLRENSSYVPWLIHVWRDSLHNSPRRKQCLTCAGIRASRNSAAFWSRDSFACCSEKCTVRQSVGLVSGVWRIHVCVTWLIHMRGTNAFICVILVIYTCDTTHSCVWHDTSMCVWHDSSTRVTWHVHTWDMTYSVGGNCLWCDTFMCVWHDSSICMTWLIYMCDMTHSYVSHDLFSGWK